MGSRYMVPQKSVPGWVRSGPALGLQFREQSVMGETRFGGRILRRKNYISETKIQELTTNQDSLWTQLQPMGQDLQAMLLSLHPSSSHQNMVPKGGLGKGERFSRGGDSFQIKNANEDGSEWEPLANPTVIDRSCQSPASAEHVLPNSGSPEDTVQPRSTQSARAQSQLQKTSKEILSSLSSSQEGLPQDTPPAVPAGMTGPALALLEKKETVTILEGKDELEEGELQELLSKPTDALTLEVPS
ncbi:hypothetical protein MC885_006580, partial [Smutsia gigantea]